MNRDEPLPNISLLHHHGTSSSSTAKVPDGMIDRYSIHGSDDRKIIEAKDTNTDGGKQKQQQRHHHSSYIITPNDIRPYDVLCGRDKAVFNSIGNRRFRVSISVNVPGYEMARNKAQKTTVIMYVCSMLRNEVGVRFLKKGQPRGEGGGGGGGALKKGSSLEEEYHYIELDEAEARKKVGHALRDMSVARKQLNEERKSSLVRIHTKKGSTPARKSKKRQRDHYDGVQQSRQRVSDDTFDDDGNDDDDEEKDEGLVNRRRPRIAEGSAYLGDSLTALLPYVSEGRTFEEEEEDTTFLEPLSIFGEISPAQQHLPQDDTDPRRVSIHEHEHHTQELKSQSQQQPQQAMEVMLQTQQQQQQQHSPQDDNNPRRVSIHEHEHHKQELKSQSQQQPQQAMELILQTQQQQQLDPHRRVSLSYLQQQQHPQLHQLQQLQQQFQQVQNWRRRLLPLQQQQQEQEQIERQRQQQHGPLFGIQQQQQEQDPHQRLHLLQQQQQQQQRHLQLQHHSYHQQQEQEQKHQDQDQDQDQAPH